MNEQRKTPYIGESQNVRGPEGGRVTSGIRTHDIQNHNLTL